MWVRHVTIVLTVVVCLFVELELVFDVRRERDVARVNNEKGRIIDGANLREVVSEEVLAYQTARPRKICEILSLIWGDRFQPAVFE